MIESSCTVWLKTFYLLIDYHNVTILQHILSGVFSTGATGALAPVILGDILLSTPFSTRIFGTIPPCQQVSVVMWLAPWPPVRETRVQIPEQHGNLVKFILVWVFFNPSGILTQP